jgi:hypothetical protein
MFSGDFSLIGYNSLTGGRLRGFSGVQKLPKTYLKAAQKLPKSWLFRPKS